MQPKDEDGFRWGLQLVACFDDLREDLAARSPAIVDKEVLPHFDGRPDDMFIWFICRKADEVPQVKQQEAELRQAIQQRMAACGFPEHAIRTLKTSATSLEDIEAGGGRFYFFR